MRVLFKQRCFVAPVCISDDECAYKRYKKVYTRVAAEAQDNHYREMFVLWFLILKSRYVALDSVDNSNDCKKWLVDLTIVSVWYSSVVLL